MADKQQQNPESTSNTFSKGMLKDTNETFVGEGLYTHARNAANNSHDGQIGVIGNEPSNLECVELPYTMIGCIHLLDDQWAIFTTDDVDSEIGIFDESDCTYETRVNDQCLAFKRSNLITGLFRKRYDCERLLYWDDGLNPTRSMDLDKIPWIQNCVTVNGCTTCTDTNVLDCEKIRIAPYIQHPCISIKRGQVSGTLPNGTYQACIAYTIDEVRITDYIGLTNPQGLFSHENTSSSLQIDITNIDESFDEFELVILVNVNSQSYAKRVGYYTTAQGTIYIDRLDTEYVNVSVGSVVFRSEPIEKSDAMYSVNNYLLRTGVYNKYRFNYQPLANQIRTKWVAVQYPEDYYIKGNNNAGYMRDEQYAFFIRFVYNTGEFSDSYHIPGRPPSTSDRNLVTGGDAFETVGPNAITRERWQIENTATVTSTSQSSPSYLNGGTIIASGDMGFWESTEKYPSNRPDIWDSFPGQTSPLNLCGQPIRHHKMPDETRDTLLSTFNSNGANIVLLGIQFENIIFPKDQNGNVIQSIVGYEILRGSREGNKSIIAKGLLNNMREYPIPTGTAGSQSTTTGGGTTGGGTTGGGGGLTRPGSSGVTGLFQNYPYNDLRPDRYLTTAVQTGLNGFVDPTPSNTPYLTSNINNIFSFHSPDTTFSNPYLNAVELKVYQNHFGTAYGQFQIPYKHPKFKIASNMLSIINTILSLINAIDTVNSIYGSGSVGIMATDEFPVSITYELPPFPPFPAPAGGDIASTAVNIAAIALFGVQVAAWALTVGAIIALSVALLEVKSEKTYQLFLGLVPKRQYGVQYNSHGFYNQAAINGSGNRRRQIEEAVYVGNNIQQFTTNYQINNLNRNKSVVLKVASDISPTNTDTSRFLMSEINADINTTYPSNISSYYGALKLSIPSQYGQLESIKELPISTCIGTLSQTAPSSTIVFFGGDVYINRFTEKNSMFFFTNWLMGEPDLIEYDYTQYINIPYPRHWVNNNERHSAYKLADDYRMLDQRTPSSSGFYIKYGWFYLFNSGVRDFFVESEVNVAYRDWEEDAARRHYDPYRFTELSLMFRSDIIQSGNYYKYDYSLSISKLFNSSISWGNLLPRDYDPVIASTCYTYRPNRVIYSLPQQDQSKKDNWRVYLTNNYKDFMSPVTAIKQVNKTGAIFMMKWQSPLQFMGVEELKLDGTGAKITIGDAGLFTGPQQLQSIVNADESYEYGSNQGRYCSINTTYGVFWVSQNQGKVFQYGGQLAEISDDGMKWWFAKYLPSQLLSIYPKYPLYDNPAIGVGVQMIYDNTYNIVYITKKDYKPKVPLTYAHPDTGLPYDSEGQFWLNQTTPISFTDTTYFENSSFTVSYDPKVKAWISFHDWIPSFLIPGRAHFMSVAPQSGSDFDSIWKHNIRCDSYCNYYGVDYPFEIEFISATGQQVNSMRSIEYLLEVYKYHNECRDKFHVLDENFDQAIIYNSEQVSGVLKLNIKAKNDPLGMLTYPRINTNPDYIDIQFSKEENKYRFNQFWDITKNRGEYVPINLPMFNTESNGYIYPINPAYIDYNKAPLERKKFRHNVNRVFLRKFVSDNNKFLFKISNQKLLQSPR